MTQLHTWARALPKPKAILIVSAHWESGADAGVGRGSRGPAKSYWRNTQKDPVRWPGPS